MKQIISLLLNRSAEHPPVPAHVPDAAVPASSVAVVGATMEVTPNKVEWWKILALVSVALVLTFGMLQFIVMIARPLAILFGAVIIAEAMMPAVNRLQRFMPRVLATLLMYVALLAVFTGIGWIVFPSLVEQATEVVDRGPELIEDGRELINRWGPVDDARVEELITERLEGGAGALSSVPFAVMSSLLEVFLVIVMSIYWVIAAPSMSRFLLSLFPVHRRSHAQSVMGEMSGAVGGYVRGTAVNAVVIGTTTYVGLLIIGVPYPLVLALIAALGEFVPIAGPIVAGIPAVLFALIESPGMALIVLIFYVVLQQLESNLLLPLVMSSQAQVPPLLVVFAIFVGGSLAGILGALIAIPLSGALRVLVVRVVAPAVRNWAGAPPEPEPDDGDESSDGAAHPARSSAG